MLNIFKFSQFYGSIPAKDSDEDIIYDEGRYDNRALNQNIKNMSLDRKSLEVMSIGSYPKGTLSRSVSSVSKSSDDSNGKKDSYISGNDVTIVANTMNALLGVSLFAMPWGFMQSGVMGGCLLVFVISLLSFETARILLMAQRVVYDRTGNGNEYHDSSPYVVWLLLFEPLKFMMPHKFMDLLQIICYDVGDIKSYPEIAQLVMGSSYYSSLVQIATLVSCIGGCVGYLIFLGETVGQLFSITLSESIYYVTGPLILLSWVRSFRNLSYFTIISVLAMILAVFAIIFDGSSKMKGSASDVPLFLPLHSTLQFLGPATFLFTIHYCVLSMGAESLHDKVDPILERTNHITRDIADLIEFAETTLDYEYGPTSRGQSSRRDGNGVDGSSTTESLTSQLSSSKMPTLTRPLVYAYILSVVMIALLGSGGFVVYRNADEVR